jgi:hypothetical protein
VEHHTVNSDNHHKNQKKSHQQKYISSGGVVAEKIGQLGNYGFHGQPLVPLPLIRVVRQWECPSPHLPDTNTVPFKSITLVIYMTKGLPVHVHFKIRTKPQKGS